MMTKNQESVSTFKKWLCEERKDLSDKNKLGQLSQLVFAHLEKSYSSLEWGSLDQRLQTFSVKRQTVNTLGFVGHRISVTI